MRKKRREFHPCDKPISANLGEMGDAHFFGGEGKKSRELDRNIPCQCSAFKSRICARGKKDEREREREREREISFLPHLQQGENVLRGELLTTARHKSSTSMRRISQYSFPELFPHRLTDCLGESCCEVTSISMCMNGGSLVPACVSRSHFKFLGF